MCVWTSIRKHSFMAGTWSLSRDYGTNIPNNINLVGIVKGKLKHSLWFQEIKSPTHLPWVFCFLSTSLRLYHPHTWPQAHGIYLRPEVIASSEPTLSACPCWSAIHVGCSQRCRTFLGLGCHSAAYTMRLCEPKEGYLKTTGRYIYRECYMYHAILS